MNNNNNRVLDCFASRLLMASPVFVIASLRSNPEKKHCILDCFVPRNDVNICHLRLFDCKSYQFAMTWHSSFCVIVRNALSREGMKRNPE